MVQLSSFLTMLIVRLEKPGVYNLSLHVSPARHLTSLTGLIWTFLLSTLRPTLQSPPGSNCEITLKIMRSLPDRLLHLGNAFVPEVTCCSLPTISTLQTASVRVKNVHQKCTRQCMSAYSSLQGICSVFVPPEGRGVGGLGGWDEGR